MNKVHTYRRSTMEVNVTYRRFYINFANVPALPDFKEGDTIVDPKHCFTGPICPGGLDKLHQGKVRIFNPKSKKRKYLLGRDCLYVPPSKSLWRLKDKNSPSWWVTCMEDQDTVTLRAIKVYSTKNAQAKAVRKEKLRDIAYVFVFKTTFIFCFIQTTLTLTQREDSCCRWHCRRRGRRRCQRGHQHPHCQRRGQRRCQRHCQSICKSQTRHNRR